MEITSGMALTYDILYDYLSPTDRATLRAALKRSIDTIQPRFAVGQYWTEDYQNNHMHNRIHGLAHASFAIYGDDRGDQRADRRRPGGRLLHKGHPWLPDDGSTHEGPGYWDYGYHWVARTAKLIGHVTGVDPAAGKPHISQRLSLPFVYDHAGVEQHVQHRRRRRGARQQRRRRGCRGSRAPATPRRIR